MRRTILLQPGDERWRSLPTPEGNTFAWDDKSTYVRKAPYFDGMPAEPQPVKDITGARVLALLGDSVTTDHISPAGSIKKGTPAADYLEANTSLRGVIPISCGIDAHNYTPSFAPRTMHVLWYR